MSKTLKYLLFTWACCLVVSCYEKVPGCIDTLAENYSITADYDCDDCCTYPSLSVRVFQMYDSLSIAALDTLTNTFGQRVVFHNFEWLASNWKLIDDSGSKNAVQDSIDIQSIINGVSDSSRVVDDIILVNPSQSTYALGTFIHPDSYVAVSVDIGLRDAVNYVVRDELDSEHVLLNDADTLYISQGEGFVFGRLEVQKDVTDSTSLVSYDLYGDTFPLGHSWAIDTSYTKGNDIELSLNLDFKKWLEDIDWDQDDSAVLSALELHFADLFQ